MKSRMFYSLLYAKTPPKIPFHSNKFFPLLECPLSPRKRGFEIHISPKYSSRFTLYEKRILLAAAVKSDIFIPVEKSFLQVILAFYDDQ